MRRHATPLLRLFVGLGLMASVVAGTATARADSVSYTDNGDSVTFANQDGHWTIWKNCVRDTVNGGDLIGPGYIGRYVTNAGYTAVDGYGAGGGRQFTDPREGGLGIFGYFESRGDPQPDWSNVWEMSNRACAADLGGFGVKSVTSPSYGVDASGHGYYDQDVFLGDAFVTDKQVWVRYHWRFDDSNVRLYTMVVQDCTYGSCGSDSRTVYLKSPMFVNNISGQFSSTRPDHVSTFTSDGKYIASTAGKQTTVSCSQVGGTSSDCVDAGYECTWKPLAGTTPANTTAHCFYDGRARTRFDYGNGSIAAGCNTTSQECFDVVARAYPVTNLDVPPGGSAYDWEGSGIGLDQWAVNAHNDPAAGSNACGIEGSSVTDPSAQLARDWEYVANTPSTASSLLNMEVLDKAWDNCQSAPDASSLFRRMEGWDQAYGAFFSYSINSGWTMQ